MSLTFAKHYHIGVHLVFLSLAVEQLKEDMGRNWLHSHPSRPTKARNTSNVQPKTKILIRILGLWSKSIYTKKNQTVVKVKVIIWMGSIHPTDIPTHLAGVSGGNCFGRHLCAQLEPDYPPSPFLWAHAAWHPRHPQAIPKPPKNEAMEMFLPHARTDI